MDVVWQPSTSQVLAESQWSVPQLIPEHHDLSHAPHMVTDRHNTVHAFELATEDSESGPIHLIYYRTWTLAQGWSSPVDILVPEFLGLAPTLLGVIIDQSDQIHLIYYGGNRLVGSIFYATADANRADRTGAWSVPVAVGIDAGPIAAAAITGDSKGTLAIVYAGIRIGAGLYSVHSSNDGETWSGPYLISRSREEELWPGLVWLDMDDEGRVHAVWYMANSRGQGVETRYARSTTDMADWESEFIVSRKDTEVEFNGWPSILVDGNRLIIAFYDGFPPTRYIRQSEDSGETWSSPFRPFPHQGGYRQTILLKDSAGSIHMILGNRLQDPEIHGMWHSELVGNRWLPLTPIISAPPTDSFDPTGPSAVIVGGNVLLATWTNDVLQEFRTGAWYSYRTLDAPALTSDQLPASVEQTPTSTPRIGSQVSTVSPSPTIKATITAGLDLENTTTSHSVNPASPVFLGIFPIIILVVLVIIRQYVRR